MRHPRIFHSIVFSLVLACAPALATNICGPLNGTLDLVGSPYVATCDISVAFGDTLNLDPGVEIRFNDFTALTVDGTLNAKGTAADGVLFTSNSGAPFGIWNGVTVNGQATFDYATVRYATWTAAYGNADFANCAFEWNNYGLRFEVGSSGSVTGGSFSFNTYGLVIRGDTSVTASGTVFDQNDIAGYLMGPNVYPVLSSLTVNENHTIHNGIEVDPGPGNWSKGGTWTDAGCPYMIGISNLTFNPGVTLTVEAGVVIKMGSNSLNLDDLIVNGTSGSPVVFTSFRDDSVGGDTNGDGGATSPSGGDWNALTLNGPGSTLDYAVVKYAQQSIVTGDAAFVNCTFEWNQAGLRFEVGSSGSVTGGLFSFNTYGLVISGDTSVTASGAVFDQNDVAGYLEGPNVYPALSNLTVNENHTWLNGIEVSPGPGNWSKGGTWTDAGCPYVIGAADLNFDPLTTLTVEAGTVIKMSFISLNFETLDVNGTSGSPVVFTSISDDSVGGDTGADGPTSGSSGSWNELTLNGPGSTLDYVTVRYMQQSVVTGDAAFANCAFEQSWTGLQFDIGSSGTVTGGLFSLNDTGFEILGDSSVTASGAVFDQNDRAGYLEGPNVYPALSNLTVNENHVWLNGIEVSPGPGNWSKGGTWTDAGCPYVIQGNITFDPATTLTVEAGAVIKMNFNSLNLDDLIVNGTSGSPVVFTSFGDDSVGGDTNADGPTSGSSGSWNELTLNGPGSTLDYAIVKYAQRSTVYGSADFTNCAFEDNVTGVRFEAGSSGSVTGGLFSLNDTGFEILGGASVTASGAVFDQNMRAGYLEGPNVYPALSNLTVNENHTWINGIEVSPGPGNWSVSGTWTDAGCPYVIGAGDLNFDPLTTLTVEAGAVIKMVFISMNLDDLIVNGTSGSPVVFTSLYDDSVGGDTNADGGATSPGPGDWNGIRVISGTTHTLNGARVSYAGTGIVFEGVTGTVDQSSFFQNLTGLSFELGGSAVVTNSGFAGNDTGVSVDAASLPDLGDLNDASPLNDGLNDFVCNTVHVSNANAATVLAENNWWGDAPPNPALFVGSVDYDPYLAGQSQPVLTGLTVSLVNGNDDVRLAWEDAAPACGYRVLRSELPDSGFTDISGLILANTYDDVGAGSSPTDYYYLVAVD